MASTVDHAHFLAVWLEGLLYGVYVVLFLGCFYILYTRPVNGTRPTVILSALALMFLLNTVHVVGTLRYVELAFFNTQPGGAPVYLSDRSQPLNILNKVIYASVVIIGDILPSIMLLVATSATGFTLVAFYSLLKPGDSVFSGQMAVLTPATLILSLVSNILTTGLIAYRIRSVSKAVKFTPLAPSKSVALARNYRYSLAVIIESGAIYPIFLILGCILYLAGLNEQAIITGSMCQRIVPTLAVLMVRLGLSRYDAAYADQHQSTANHTMVPSRSYPLQGFRADNSVSSGGRKSLVGQRSFSRMSSTYDEEDMIKADGASEILDMPDPSVISLPSTELAATSTSDLSHCPLNEKPNHLRGVMKLDRPMSIHLQRTVFQHIDAPSQSIPSMTGLNHKTDRIIEIAVLITNGKLETVDEGINYVIKTDKKILDEMDPWCVTQHAKTGLTEACINSPHDFDFVSAAVLEYVKRWIPEPRVGILAGSSVHADKAFLGESMPDLVKHLHYRIVDVSTIKELCYRWYPGHRRSVAETSHRALDDIRGSIEELRFYKQTIFKDKPFAPPAA
ncbi:hypothetical protein FRB99_002891 [Tulasnella sp. 403]|nr:hypothetical protein FRB99_002891 [Tulasnella sp. 403]